jgi:septal ring factor EnvC (AmiA/AmiB activator)
MTRRLRPPPGRARRGRILLAPLLGVALALVAAPLPAQQEPSESRLREQREELERLRRERRDLELRMQTLRSNVHDIEAEVDLLDRQADATARAVRSLDKQLSAINDEVGTATARLVRAEDELVVKRAALRRRLADIYKRGPLYTIEVILSAQSFGDLVARYKYLHLLARRDRALVERVEQLRNQIGRQRGLLVRLQTDLEVSRGEKSYEEQRLRALEDERARSLAQVKRSARQTEARLARIARDEQRLTDVIASLEAARRRAESARPNAPRGAATLSTSALGTLDWPVEGDIIYRFGRVVNPNNTATRWNGIGIEAALGSDVKAVERGEVMVAESFGTYGLTIIVQHPGGDYSVYGSLGSLAVQAGAEVTKGQIIGTVGRADPDLPPHVHFEVRPGGRAVDPLDWLRSRR